MRKTLPYGRVFRTEDSSLRKSLPYARVFRTQEFSTQKTLPYGRVFCTEESCMRQLRLLWRGHRLPIRSDPEPITDHRSRLFSELDKEPYHDGIKKL